MQRPPPATSADTSAEPIDASGGDDIVIVGSGETRPVSTLLPSNLDTLPPGTSIQKSLNFPLGASAQSIDALAVNDLGIGYDFGGVGPMKGVKLWLNVTNLSDKRYAANLDSSVFASDDASGIIVVVYSSAPRQFFGTLRAAF